MTESLSDDVYALWDRLADVDAGDFAGAREIFLSALCRLVDAQNAAWVGAVLMDRHVPGDPLRGWRPRAMHRLVTGPKSQELVRNKARALEQGKADIVTIRRVAQAGRFRVHRLVDIAPEGWFESAHYRTFYEGHGHLDSLWAGIPINHDVEIYVGLYRDTTHGWFSEADRETFAFALRGLKWFHRRQLLGEGLGVVSEPLTPTERLVLGGLLRGSSEREIADTNGQSPHTTHDHVKRIYRKYGVSSRSALMALWLGSPP